MRSILFSVVFLCSALASAKEPAKKPAQKPAEAAAPAAAAQQPAGATVTVTVTNIKAEKGNLRAVLVAEKADFPDGKNAAYRAVASAKPESVTLSVAGVKPGKYAIAVYQDKNDNGTLETNFLGIPQEPYGFSNGGMMPNFDNSALNVEKDTTVEVKLQ